ncbi:MAG: energy transducer TonB [Bdellovibrionales bacterium]|nr:energy transducer TonB [Bdellovibrionales bacterium]
MTSAIRLRSSLTISFGLHAFFLLAWAYVATQALTRPTPSETVYVELEDSKSKRNRIVQSQLVKPSDEAKKDAFLGKQNQIVDRQTVSKTKQIQGEAAGRATQKAQAKAPEKAEKRSEKFSGKLSQLGVPMLQPKVANRAPADVGRFQNPEFGGGQAPSDYVDGLKESESTMLNTREYVFFGYFHRIRERLDLAWTATLREKFEKLYRAGRSIASEKEHTTRLMVFLNELGEIKKVQVVEESGTRDLDDAAVRAFNQAGPFPNPPKGLIEPDGLVRIKWDFVLRT